MKRIDFLKSLTVPFVIPFLPENEEPKPQPGDLARFDGKKYRPMGSALPSTESGKVLTISEGQPEWKDLDQPWITVYRGTSSTFITDSFV